MGLGDWLRGQLNDTTYGDGWEARQQEAQAALSLRFLQERRAEAYQRKQMEQMDRTSKRQAVNDYFNDIGRLAENAGSFDASGGFVAPKLPAPPADFPYSPEDTAGLFSNVARANAEKRREAQVEGQARMARTRSQIALDEARARAATEVDPYKRAKLLADIERAQASTAFTNAQLGGWVPPAQAWGLGLRGTNPATGSDPVALLDFLNKSGMLGPAGTRGGNPFAAPGYGAPPPPAAPPPQRPGALPMPASVKAGGGTVRLPNGNVVPWEQVPPAWQKDIIQRTGG